jgi:hypothetical protein
MTGNTKTIDNYSYFEVTQVANGVTSTGYVRKQDGAYYNRGVISPTAEIELIILKDNVAKGTTWSQSYTINGIATTYKFTLANPDTTYTGHITTFTKVMKVRFDTIYPILGDQPAFTENLYFAYGIGLVATSVTDLQSYTIK